MGEERRGGRGKPFSDVRRVTNTYYTCDTLHNFTKKLMLSLNSVNGHRTLVYNSARLLLLFHLMAATRLVLVLIYKII